MSAFEKLPAIPRIGSLGKAVSPPRTKRWCVQRIDVDRASSDGAQLHAVYCTHNISAIILGVAHSGKGPNATPLSQYPRGEER